MAARARKSSDRNETSVDPIIEAYKRGIDRSLLRQTLSRSPEERVLALTARQRNLDSADDLSDVKLTALVAGEAVSEVRVQEDRVEVRFMSGRSLMIELGAMELLLALPRQRGDDMEGLEGG